tara:strand:+ start:1323 stop:1544 length:222 start_codon:yes stop_codon:yes gene_type:complete
MDTIETLLKTLSLGTAKITYKTVNSGRTESVIGTMKGKPMHQNSTSDVIVVQNTETKQYQDIRVSTIKDWKKI